MEVETIVQAKKSRSKKPKKDNYFSEKIIINLVKDYKATKSDDTFKKMSLPIESMINGMINKEFYYNNIVKNNRDDIIAECFFEILKSLEKYDPDKGRVFAYFNRIVKNTILRCYNKIKKHNSKELLYTNFSKNVSDSLDDDTVLNLGQKNNVNKDIFSTPDTLLPLGTNKSLSSKESYYIIYKYIITLKNNIDIYINNLDLRSKLLLDVKTDPDVLFDFSKYSHSNLLNDKMVFTKIVVAIDITLDELLKWLSKKYPNIQDAEPRTFNAKIQQRAVNTVKNYVNDSIKQSKLTDFYEIEDIILLIRYIINRNIKFELRTDF